MHVDQGLQDKIKRGEFVDFAKLLLRECVLDDEGRMEMVVRDGQTIFVPARDKEGITGGVTSLHKWEQVFRVYSNIYLTQNPARATELVQYNHKICTASSSYLWENVYTYDREFRMHMSKYPKCNWGIILQQAWTMFLKDRLRAGNDGARAFPGQGNSRRKKEICKRFNKGKCTAGLSCKYDHRCLECGKFGHGAHICRKRSNGVGNPSNTSNAMMPASNASNNNRN